MLRGICVFLASFGYAFSLRLPFASRTSFSFPLFVVCVHLFAIFSRMNTSFCAFLTTSSRWVWFRRTRATLPFLAVRRLPLLLFARFTLRKKDSPHAHARLCLGLIEHCSWNIAFLPLCTRIHARLRGIADLALPFCFARRAYLYRATGSFW